MKLSELASWLRLPCPQDAEFFAVRIDSRAVQPGDLFVAFSGEHVDGHQFAASAVANGATAIMAERPIEGLSAPVLVVGDCLQALTDSSRHYRQQMNAKILALTGSNGKTSVKEMLAAILPKPSFASKGNFNNQLGVPVNLLSVQSSDLFALFELGANQKGDIEHTASLVKPDIALINNIGPAHLGGFGSIEGVAIAKGEIYQSLGVNGIAVINDDDAFSHFWDEVIAHHQVIRFSSQHQADVWADEMIADSAGCCAFLLHIGEIAQRVTLQVPGRHQVQNALAAASMAHAAGIDVQQIANGLIQFGGVAGRLKVSQGLNQSTIIDDTYNANLESIRVGLEFLSKRMGHKIFVMGDLAELGTYTDSQHREVGSIAKGFGIDELYAVGQFTPSAVNAFGPGAKHFENRKELVEHLKKQLNNQTHVLVKGSRSAKMEEIIKQLSN